MQVDDTESDDITISVKILHAEPLKDQIQYYFLKKKKGKKSYFHSKSKAPQKIPLHNNALKQTGLFLN